MLLDVRQYNGLADDDNVLVGVYTTGNFRSAECNDGPPSWDGNDAWPIDVESALGSVPACNGTPSPSVFDAFAYVADNQLVAHFDEVTLAIEFDPNTLRLTLRDAVVVAPLQQDADGRWSTEGGILAGTWPVDGVFRSLGSLDAVTPLDLCGSELRSIQSTVCGAADLATHSRTADPCDAVSLAIAFKAEEATFGNTVTLPPTTSCPELLALDCETAVR